MPELPDIAVYVEALEKRIVNRTLRHITVGNPFLLRTAEPPISEAQGKPVQRVFRIGKRIAIELVGGMTLVLHLMIAGRLHWREPGEKRASQRPLAVFEFDGGALILTEAGTKRRASLHLLRTGPAVDALDPGGIDVLESSASDFSSRLRSENHTLKRALTDPRLFSGIGNSYSDEILFEARLSPFALTGKLTDAEVQALYDAARTVLRQWIDRLRAEAREGFPEKVTAFRPEMAVHGRYRLPCPRCGSAVQRIRYADNETNYCAPCQTGGKLLSDRALARLLGQDWPKTVEGLETLTRNHKATLTGE